MSAGCLVPVASRCSHRPAPGALSHPPNCLLLLLLDLLPRSRGLGRAPAGPGPLLGKSQLPDARVLTVHCCRCRRSCQGQEDQEGQTPGQSWGRHHMHRAELVGEALRVGTAK